MGKIWAGLGFVFTLLAIYLGFVLSQALTYWNYAKFTDSKTAAIVKKCLDGSEGTNILAAPSEPLSASEAAELQDKCVSSAYFLQNRSRDLFVTGPAQEVFTLLVAVLLAAGFFYLYKRSLTAAR